MTIRSAVLNLRMRELHDPMNGDRLSKPMFLSLLPIRKGWVPCCEPESRPRLVIDCIGGSEALSGVEANLRSKFNSSWDVLRVRRTW
jgi:hypothetical protein